MKKSIKFYFHHNQYHEMVFKTKSGWFSKILFSPLQLLYLLCFSVGWIVLQIVNKFLYFAKTIINIVRQFSKDLSKKRLPFNTLEFKTSLVSFAVLLIIVSIFLQSGTVVSNGLEIKGKVLGNATKGIDQLKQAQQSLQNQQEDIAQQQLAGALKQFEQTQKDIEGVGGVLNNLLDVFPQKRDGENLLNAVTEVTQAGIELTQTYQLVKEIKVSPQGISFSSVSTKEATDIFNNSLKRAIQRVDTASSAIEKVSPDSLPENLTTTFIQARDTLFIAQKSLHNFFGVFELFDKLFLGQKHILVLFQNNNELRASGGFMGTYGSLKMRDGSINSMKISSIYDLDGQLKENIAPPLPLYAVNYRWFLRDSNWFFNFPDSARKIISFYEKEGGETPDIVITMTPELITKLLAITGPVYLEKYGISLSSETFIELTQLATSINYDREQNEPKQMLADFFPIMLQKIGTLEMKQRLSALEALQQSLNTKSLLLYATDIETQRQIEAFHWGGQVTTTDRDYLAIVSSNLGGTKTDTYIDQTLNLITEVQKNGEIINTLSITRKNTLPNFETMMNSSYIRVFVPEGSELIEASGFNLNKIVPQNNSTVTDPDVKKLEETMVQNITNGTYTNLEAGKTVFGNWMITRGGQTQTAVVRYKLPFTLKAVDRYSLILQKQSGNTRTNVEYSVKSPDRKIIWSSSNSDLGNNHLLETNYKLENDSFIGLVIQK